MRNFIFYTIAILICIGSFKSYSQLQVNTANHPSLSAQINFIGGSMSISNVTFQGTYSNSGSSQFGEFSSSNTNLGVNQGIIMTTGNIFDVPDSALKMMSTFIGGSGSSVIDMISGNTSYDAAVLEFDFVPLENTLNFNYVFASEEYHTYVNSSFNDAFGFFISGPNPFGGDYLDSNIAILPGTNIPVSINNVNNGYTGSYCSSGPCYNCAFFVDNCLDTNIIFNGFTANLYARCYVTPNQTYHIKIAVGDVGDGILDSGVFLEAGSFASFTTIWDNTFRSIRSYPNPASDIVYIENISKKNETFVSIIDIQGRTIIQNTLVTTNPFSINVSELEAGLYFLRIFDNTETTLIKILKE